MGRRKWYQYKKRRNGKQEAKSNSDQKYSLKDRKLLIQYLNEYYDRCTRLYNGSIFGTRKLTKTSISDSDEPIVIGGCAFPKLDEEVLRQPYLALPIVNAKRRKIIHHLCVYANLYHVGVRVTPVDSYVAISIFKDGLDFASKESECDPKVNFLSFNPWFYRAGDTVAEATKVGHDEIYKLIDQPGDCLRDGIDELDFLELQDASLDNIAPPRIQDDNWMLVDSPEAMRMCVQEIEADNITELAVDIECFHRTKAQSITCLIQLATSSGKEYVIDTLAPGVWDVVGELAPFFADPKVVKIGHAIGGLDVQSLQRDFGIFVVNAFDTQEAAKALQLKKVGLAHVCGSYGLKDSVDYEDLKKVYQNCNWSVRPMEENMIVYARYDVHCLILMRKLMIRDLAKEGCFDESNPKDTDAEGMAVAETMAAMWNDFDEDEYEFAGTTLSPVETTNANDTVGVDTDTPKRSSKLDACELRMNAALMQVISKSQEMCVKFWKGKKEAHLKDPDFQEIVLASKKGEIPEWTPSQLNLYDRLASWREDMAKQEKCLAGFICPLGFLALLAYKRPATQSALLQVNFQPSEYFKRADLTDLFDMVKESRREDGVRNDDASYSRTHPELIRRLERRLQFKEFSFVALTTTGVAVAALAAVKVLGRRK